MTYVSSASETTMKSRSTKITNQSPFTLQASEEMKFPGHLNDSRGLHFLCTPPNNDGL